MIRLWLLWPRVFQVEVANPGGVAASLLFVVGSLGEEDGAEIAVAEAMDSELAVVDGGALWRMHSGADSTSS